MILVFLNSLTMLLSYFSSKLKNKFFLPESRSLYELKKVFVKKLIKRNLFKY